MCGILGVIIKKKGRNLKVVKNLYKIYKNQHLRGKDGAGLTVYSGGRMKRIRNIEPEVLFSIMYFKFWRKLQNGDIVLFHHRWPSSGGQGDSIRSNHPLANEDGSIHLIHNGVIGNVDDLYNKLIQIGHRFESNICKKEGYYNITDSEVLVHLLETHEDVKESIKFLAKNVEGSLAIAFVKRGDDGVWLYRERNPIEVFRDVHGNVYFASEMPEDKSIKRLGTIDERTLYKLEGSGLTRFRKIRKKKVTQIDREWYGFDKDGNWVGYEGDGRGSKW